LLFRKGRLVLPVQHTPASYMEDIVQTLALTVLPLSPAITELAESGFVAHGDPADPFDCRHGLGAPRAANHRRRKLRTTHGLRCIW